MSLHKSRYDSHVVNQTVTPENWSETHCRHGKLYRECKVHKHLVKFDTTMVTELSGRSINNRTGMELVGRSINNTAMSELGGRSHNTTTIP